MLIESVSITTLDVRQSLMSHRPDPLRVPRGPSRASDRAISRPFPAALQSSLLVRSMPPDRQLPKRGVVAELGARDQSARLKEPILNLEWPVLGRLLVLFVIGSRQSKSEQQKAIVRSPVMSCCISAFGLNAYRLTDSLRLAVDRGLCELASMGALHKSDVLIGFYGDDLDPAEVTAALGAEPTVGARKGDPWILKSGATKIARRGSWRIKAERCEPGDLDGQITELLDRLSDDLAAWRSLSQRFRGVVFCGLFLASGNEGSELRPETLARLGERGLVLDLDIYGLD